jgi:hypothetical protein
MLCKYERNASLLTNYIIDVGVVADENTPG